LNENEIENEMQGKCVVVQSLWRGEVEAGVNRKAVSGLYVVLPTSYQLRGKASITAAVTGVVA
jgi:hypothetical protein